MTDILAALLVGIVIAIILWLRLEAARRRRLAKEREEWQRKRDEEAAELEKARRSIAPMKDPSAAIGMGAPEKLDDGARYDARSGATIYRDSEVMRMFIGSEEEERAAERGILPKSPKLTEGEWPRSSCATCLGHGRLNFGLGNICPNCNGLGSTRKK